jgi:SAM-dependent methyltransferase
LIVTETVSREIWDEGDAYERYVGRWSRQVADLFLRWLSLPESLTWLDVGSGTGALTAAIVAAVKPQEVIAVEPSDGFRVMARERLPGGATFLPGSASAIPLQDASVDVAVSGLVLNFIPDLSQGLAEIKRVVKPGGTIAAYIWDYAEGMELMRHFWDAVVSLWPESRHLDEGVRFPLCHPHALAAAFTDAGLTDVEVAPLTTSTPFRDFNDYWLPFLGGQGPAPAFVSSLDEDARATLRDRIKKTLPTNPDGSIVLQARAWAVKGRRVT